MNIHKNACPTLLRRQELARRALRVRADITALAAEFGVSRQTVYKWRARWLAEGSAGMADRAPTPHHSPGRLPRRQRRQVHRRRAARWSSGRIAEDLGLALPTIVRECRRVGLARLPALTPPRPIVRYEWPSAGDLLHLDVKKQGKIGRVGHRIHGDRTQRVDGIGWEYTHVAVDDHSRVAYAEVLPDERGPTTVGFLERAVAWFAAQGVTVRRLLTDNGANYRAHVFRHAVARLALQHRRTRSYTPQTNGKAERFIRTLLQHWAYARAYRLSVWRQLALPRFLQWYNTQRRHYGINGTIPASRLPAAL